MPLYDYRCEKCGTTVEERHGFNEHPPVMCPRCAAGALPMKRVILPPGPTSKIEPSPPLKQKKVYQYRCNAQITVGSETYGCTYVADYEHYSGEEPEVTCPACGSREMTRVYTESDWVPKTTGFYRTDVAESHKIKSQADVL